MLDTCGFLSLVGLSERRLGGAALRLIEEAETLYVSSCSLFEIAMKNKKGNLPVRPFGTAMELWAAAVEEYRLTGSLLRKPCPARFRLLPAILFLPAMGWMRLTEI